VTRVLAPAATPFRELAEPASTITDEIDGEARPNGARADMGADEIYP
jgi:hypothetical protein